VLDRVLSQAVRTGIEEMVSAHLGHAWRITTVDSRA
jgi:hypothetical protein